MNKAVIVLRFLACSILLCATGCFSEDRTQLGRVVDQQGMITQEIKGLLDATGVPSDGTLDDTIKQTQLFWLRRPDQERWDIERYVTENEAQIRLLCNSLGMTKAIAPTYQEYDYVCIMGALFGRIKTRLDYAIELFKQGIRFKKLVFLGGARPVVPKQGEHMQNYKEVLGVDILDDQAPQTEAEIMKLVYTYISMPDQMRALPVQFIDVPMIQTDAGVRRPATDDIINGWLASNPPAGRCLCISNQPYVGFQDAVVRTYMPHDFVIDTVGSEAVANLNIGILLDTIARWLYQEGKRVKIAL